MIMKGVQKMKTKLFLAFAVFTAIVLGASSAFAAATTLTVSDVESVAPDGTATVTITASSGDLAGAAFTVTYDDTVLTAPVVTSDFFETFTDMGITATNDTGFDKGLVVNEVSGTGLRIAGANAEEKGTAGTSVEIFSISFTVASDAEEESSYAVGIIPTTLNNTDAGYDAEGEEIDLLVGIDGDTFPARLSAAEADANVTAGTITVGPPPGDIDIDGDGAFLTNDITLLRRWAAGDTWLQGDNLISGRGTVTTESTRATATDIIAYLESVKLSVLDVDGDGAFLTNDITLIRRWAAGDTWLQGDNLISGRGTVTTESTRATSSAIIDYLDNLKSKLTR
jgi:hypothetical protein